MKTDALTADDFRLHRNFVVRVVRLDAVNQAHAAAIADAKCIASVICSHIQAVLVLNGRRASMQYGH